jgi:hypothetical protein
LARSTQSAGGGGRAACRTGYPTDTAGSTSGTESRWGTSEVDVAALIAGDRLCEVEPKGRSRDPTVLRVSLTVVLHLRLTRQRTHSQEDHQSECRDAGGTTTPKLYVRTGCHDSGTPPALTETSTATATRTPTPTGEYNGAELMPKRTTATVDRLLHHAHLCQTNGDSIRLSQALTVSGVTPMNSLHLTRPLVAAARCLHDCQQTGSSDMSVGRLTQTSGAYVDR